MSERRPQPTDLWQRIEAFQLDDPDHELTFSQRLARENDWSHAFALRVIDEYKRFVYLAMTAGHEVTPSDEVDQAWHLHLTYTRSYWGELCGEVLGAPLHHGPTKGGAKEGERFEDQYEQTLQSYRDAFNAEPPTDIWPPATVRFGEAASYVRVSTHRHFIARKPWTLGRRPTVVMLGVAGLGTFGIVPLAQFELFDSIPWFWIIVGVILLIAILRAIRPGGGGGSCGGFFGCSGCGGGGCGGAGCGGGCGS